MSGSMTPEEVVALMDSSQTREEWGKNCDTVKAAFKDAYPDFWFYHILQSGLARRVMARWGGSPDFTIVTVGKDGEEKREVIRNDAAK